MRIDPSSVSLPGSTPAGGANQRNAAAASSAAAPHFPTARAGGLQPLVQQAAATEDVRTDVVDAVKTRLNAGVYLTQQAADETAAAMLQGDT